AFSGRLAIPARIIELLLGDEAVVDQDLAERARSFNGRGRLRDPRVLRISPTPHRPYVSHRRPPSSASYLRRRMRCSSRVGLRSDRTVLPRRDAGAAW